MLYIGVYGFAASTYSIKIRASKDVPAPLSPGIPQYSELEKNHYDYLYSFISHD
jgi:hypothetical protein